jgi:uncharacterized Fe-S cluster-containing protein
MEDRAMVKQMSRKDEGKAYGKLDRIEETLTFIRTQYTAEQKIKATDLVMRLEGERAYLLGLVQKEG